MDTRSNELLSFVQRESKSRGQIIDTAFERLRPHISRASSGTLALNPARAVPHEPVMKAMTMAFNAEVKDILIVPAYQPSEIPLDSDEVRRLRSGLKTGEGLADRLSRSHEYALREALSESTRRELRQLMNQAMGEQLWSAFLNTFQDHCWLKSMRAAMFDGLWYGLYYFLGFVVAGRQERADRLRPLVVMLNGALPLCERGDHTGEWIVVAR